MTRTFFKKILPAVVFVGILWLAVGYLLPVAFPFLLGAGIAFLAEPTVAFFSRRLPRWAATAVCVTGALLLLLGLVGILGALAVRQVGKLAPEMANTARQGLETLRTQLTGWAQQLPETVRPAAQRTVTELFSGGSGLLEQLPGMVTGTLGTLGNGALSLGTVVVSAYLISARLPGLKKTVAEKMPAQWQEKTLPALHRIRDALGGWLKAQLKLCAVTWGIVSLGFLLMGIPNGFLWAFVVAVVDAVPILGTGTILVPWAVVSLVRKESLRAIGLLLTYGAAAMTRTVLEPRLVGKQLGLDPLTTRAALYVGYRFWGFGGLLLTPILASAAKSVLKKPA